MWILKNLVNLINKKEKIKLSLLFLLLLFSTAIEIFSISSVPIFALSIINPQNVIIKDVISFIFINTEFLKDKILIIYIGIFLILIFILKSFILILLNFLQAKIIRDIRIRIYKELYSLYIKSNYEFHITRNSSEIIRNISSEVLNAVGSLMNSLMLAKEILIMLSVFSLLIFIDPEISSYLFLILLIVMLLFYKITAKSASKRGIIIQKIWKEIFKILNQSLGSIKIIKILNKENYLEQIFSEKIKIMEKKYFLQNFVLTLPRIVLELLGIFLIVLISTFFILLNKPLELFIPTITLISVCAARLIPSFNIISTSITAIKFQSHALNVIVNEIKNMRQLLSKNFFNEKILPEKKIFQRNVIFKNVSYNYPISSKPSLNNISFKINVGDLVGIIGKSGSGKSTLIDLITGLINPSKGEIIIDDINIKENIRSWQKLIGYVPQDIYLLDDSIKSNIAFGVPNHEINNNNLTIAIKLSQLDELIDSFEEKENKIIGEKGINLSGGQRQRLGIARGLYLNPEVLILDEPTSSLDKDTEKKIMDDIFSLKGKCTIIVVSHKSSIFNKFDKIIKLDAGKIIDI